MKSTAKKDTVKHWGEMIDWAEKQPKDERVSMMKMVEAIGQAWHSGDCSLCRICQDEYGELNCLLCPLAKKYVSCNSEESLWGGVDDSQTWGEWVVNAKKFFKQLKTL